MRVYNMYETLSDERREELRKYLQSWHQKATTVDVHGERLETGPIEFHRVTIPPTRDTPLKDGFDVVFPYSKGVTWPWVELYVNARRTFPKKYRPSFEFIPSVGWTFPKDTT